MDYQKMYTTLFNAITDALEQMESQNFGTAKETLITAQQEAEANRAAFIYGGERSNAATQTVAFRRLCTSSSHRLPM